MQSSINHRGTIMPKYMAPLLLAPSTTNKFKLYRILSSSVYILVGPLLQTESSLQSLYNYRQKKVIGDTKCNTRSARAIQPKLSDTHNMFVSIIYIYTRRA